MNPDLTAYETEVAFEVAEQITQGSARISTEIMAFGVAKEILKRSGNPLRAEANADRIARDATFILYSAKAGEPHDEAA